MSSHHIVREKQEPALLILELGLFEEEHLGQLLEWSPTVLVNDASAEKLHSLGIKFDMLLTQTEDTCFANRSSVFNPRKISGSQYYCR